MNYDLHLGFYGTISCAIVLFLGTLYIGEKAAQTKDVFIQILTVIIMVAVVYIISEGI